MRNPQVITCIGVPIDTKRIRCSQPEKMKPFFERHLDLLTEHHILEEDIWNMDEHGMGLGLCSNSIVLAKAGEKRTYKQSPENREWVTIIEAVSATGNKVRPAVIFKGVHLQTNWFDAQLTADFHYCTSKNAWTSNEIAVNWLTRIFIPETARDPPKPRILILDGHKSHISIEFQYEYFKHNIYLNYLPPHTSHVLQPLDLGVFSSVKGQYRAKIHNIALVNNADNAKKKRFIKIYEGVHKNALTPTIIKSGWQATGIIPYYPEKALNSSQL
jgi:hypothetical protein